MTKEEEIMKYLHENVFDLVLESPKASSKLKAGVNITIARMKNKDAIGMLKYFWSAVSGTERSVDFAKSLKEEGFNRFEEVLEEFRDKFNDVWISR